MAASRRSGEPDAGTLRMLIIAADTFPPFRVDVTELFGVELAGRGHRIDWILRAADPQPRAYRTQWGGGTVWVGPSNDGTSRWARLVKNARAALHDVVGLWHARKGEYDIVQVKDKFIAALPALLFAKLRGARFTFWLSYPYPEASLHEARIGTARYPLLYWIRGYIYQFLLYRVILPAADHAFVQSAQMKRDVIAKGISADKLTPVPMGVTGDLLRALPDSVARALPTTVEKAQPLDASDAIRQDPASPGSRPPDAANMPRVVYLGTLARVRRLDFLVRAFAVVCARMPGAELYFVGDGDEAQDMQSLKAEAERQGLEQRIVFTGRLPRDQALALCASASVCASPFHPTPILNSTSPTKLIEYMAMGIAVVANDHPEQREVLQASGGGICVPYEERAFGEAMLYLLSSPGVAREMGRRGRQYVESQRTYTRIADEVELQYRRLCAAEGARAVPHV